MAISSKRFLALALMVVMAENMISGNGGVVAQSCSGDITGLATQCGRYVMKGGPKIPPSQGCCDVIKKADLPCVCKSVTPPIESFISIEKVVYVAKTCGRPLTPGLKCGSVTVPPV